MHPQTHVCTVLSVMGLEIVRSVIATEHIFMIQLEMTVVSAHYCACNLIECWINAAVPKSLIWYVCVIN